MSDSTHSVLLGEIRSLKEREASLQRSLRNYSIMHAVVSIANEALTRQQLLKEILAETIRLLSFDGGGIYLLDEDSCTARIVCQLNLPEEFVKKNRTVSTAQPPYSQIFIEAKPLFSENYRDLKPEDADTFGFTSVASIPITFGETILGAYNVTTKSKQYLDEDDRHILVSIGKEIGSALFRINQQEIINTENDNLQTFINTVDDMMFVLDSKGNIILTNLAMSKKLEYEPKELIGKSVLELHVPSRRDEAAQIVADMMQGKRDFSPIPLISKSLRVIEVETRTTPGMWDNRHVIFGVTRDISDRALAETALLNETNRLKTILSMASDGIHILDTEGNLIQFSDSFARTLGYTPEEAAKLKITDWDPQLDSAKLFELVRSVGVGALSVETVHRRKDGVLINVEISSKEIEFNGVSYIYASARDITERKLAEEKMHDYAESLKTANATKDKFFSIIAHDLRGPFQNFLSISSLLDKDAFSLPPTEIQFLAKELHLALENQFELLQQLLDWARIQTGKLVISKTTLPLAETVNKILPQFQIALSNKQISTQVNIDPRIGVCVDKDSLYLIMRNMVSNSIKFTPHGGNISISALAEDDEVLIKVQDTGVGMSEDKLRSLFRIDSAKSTPGTEQEKGTGLGLILCKELIDKNSGQIWFTSEPGNGTTCIFTLSTVCQ